MNETLKPAVDVLAQLFNGHVSEFRDEVTVLIPADRIIPACQTLRDGFQFDMLIAETGMDYYPQTTPRFHVLYFLYSFSLNETLNLRVPLEGSDPSVPTLEGIYPNANWYEREIWDLFGIRFEGHSDPRRIMMPADWQGHPLRKDYPLGDEEVQFSFNLTEIDAKKPYAKE